MSFRKLTSTVRVVQPEQNGLQLSFRTFTPPENVCKVWIVGDSYIRRGAQEAAQTMGNNLGVNCQIKWFGKGGMRWSDFLSFFYHCLEGQSAPDVLVIHCGGNDLGQVKSGQLINAMKRDLGDLHLQFPRMKLILSSINQRRHWRYGPPVKVEKERKFINRVMANFVVRVKGSIIYHPEIMFNKRELFLRDKVHLSPQGSRFFLSSIAHCLRDQVGATRSDRWQ